MDNGKDQQAIRRASEINFESVIGARNRILDEVSSSSRWILATLVTVNGGAAAAIISTDKISRDAKLWSGGIASLGVIFAVLLGYSMILSAQRILPLLNELAGTWMQGVVSGHLNAMELTQRENGLQKAIRPWQIAAHVFGWLSLAAFVISVIVLGYNLK